MSGCCCARLRPGKRRYDCIQVSTSGYLEAPHDSIYNFDITDAFTLVAWIRLDDVSGNHAIVEKSHPFGGSNDGKGWGFNVAADELHTRMDHDDVTDGITKETDGLNLATDTWYHVAYTYDGSIDESGITFWIDGSAWTGTETLLSNTLASGDTIATTRPLRIADRSFAGFIDEVAVFSGAATSGDITSLYASGNVTDYSELSLSVSMVGYWRMGEGSAFSTIEDETANNNDASMEDMEARDLVLRESV